MLKNPILPLMVSSLLPLASLDAQQELKIDDSRLCDSCLILVEDVAKLESLDEPGGGVVSEPLAFSADGEGRFFTTSYQVGSEIRLFQADGTFERVVGREGEGPGRIYSYEEDEFGQPSIEVFSLEFKTPDATSISN